MSVVAEERYSRGDLDFTAIIEPACRAGAQAAGLPFYGSDIELQTTYVLDNLKKTFEAALAI